MISWIGEIFLSLSVYFVSPLPRRLLQISDFQIRVETLLANLDWRLFIAAERKALAKSWFPDTDADADQVIYTVIYTVL